MPNAKSNEVQIGGFSLIFVTKSQMLKVRKLLEGKENTHLWKGACGGSRREGRGQEPRTLFFESWRLIISLGELVAATLSLGKIISSFCNQGRSIIS